MMLQRLDFHPLPEPCADAQPDAAPGMYLDPDGNLRICDGILAVMITPDGGLVTQTHIPHEGDWNHTTCTAISHGITLRQRPAKGCALAEDDRARVVDLLRRLDRAERHDWPRLIGTEIADHGGTYPSYDERIAPGGDVVAELSLHGVRGFGRDLDGAIRNWITAAKARSAPQPPAPAPPRNHADEIADLLATRQ